MRTWERVRSRGKRHILATRAPAARTSGLGSAGAPAARSGGAQGGAAGSPPGPSVPPPAGPPPALLPPGLSSGLPPANSYPAPKNVPATLPPFCPEFRRSWRRAWGRLCPTRPRQATRHRDWRHRAKSRTVANCPCRPASPKPRSSAWRSRSVPHLSRCYGRSAWPVATCALACANAWRSRGERRERRERRSKPDAASNRAAAAESTGAGDSELAGANRRD